VAARCPAEAGSVGLRRRTGTLDATLRGMFRALKPSLTSPAVPALELIKRTVKEVLDDDCMSIAAQLAYYFALALFPALLFIVALASYLPYNVINDVVGALAPIAPPEVLTIIRKQLESIVAGEQTSLLTIGVLGALWSSSGARRTSSSSNRFGSPVTCRRAHTLRSITHPPSRKNSIERDG